LRRKETDDARTYTQRKEKSQEEDKEKGYTQEVISHHLLMNGSSVLSPAGGPIFYSSTISIPALISGIINSGYSNINQFENNN
jgi:hypothetical protein